MKVAPGATLGRLLVWRSFDPGPGTCPAAKTANKQTNKRKQGRASFEKSEEGEGGQSGDRGPETLRFGPFRSAFLCSG